MVVDTMVFAYALLGVPRFREESALVLESADDIVVPDSFRAELGNVVWQWGREHDLGRELCHAVLGDAEALVTKVVATDLLSAQALDFSMDRNHPFYDTLFVATAVKVGTKVVTYDKKLIKKFPALTILPTDYLSSET